MREELNEANKIANDRKKALFRHKTTEQELKSKTATQNKTIKLLQQVLHFCQCEKLNAKIRELELKLEKEKLQHRELESQLEEEKLQRRNVESQLEKKELENLLLRKRVRKALDHKLP